MANLDNECANLQIDDLYSQSNDTLGDIMRIQADTQENVYGYKFNEMFLSELMSYWHLNNHSMIDEIHEATDSLGGIKDGHGNAVWKRWKGAHESYRTMRFSDLSERDQLECKFEVIDMLHFFMNYAISIGMTPEEMYNMYMSKNKENRDRQARGY